MKLLVIGGGPGGYVAAIRGAQLGADVTLVESEHIGGTCLNVGCIPTKALLHTAELYESAGHSGAYGVTATPSLDWGVAQTHKQDIVNQLVRGVEGLLKVNKVRVVRAPAVFTGPTTVMAGDEKITFDKVIIATGSIPSTPPIPGVDGPQCMDSTGALALESIPATLVIVGGGVIGVELATVYQRLGCQVTIIEMMDEILPLLDKEMAGLLHAELVKQGVTIMNGAKVLEIEDCGDTAVVHAVIGDENKDVRAAKVLIAIGRRANTAGLGLETIGVKMDRGCVVVDSSQRTNVPGVFAIGDCTGGVMLAHVASAQGEVAAEVAMGEDAHYDGRTNPSCVYTSPELACVGLTEAQARDQYGDCVIGRFPLSANGKSLIEGEDGLVKIIAEPKYGEILGLAILGPRATDLIAEGALAIGTESTLDEIVATIHAHPTVAESIREAALVAQGRAIHVPNRRVAATT